MSEPGGAMPRALGCWMAAWALRSGAVEPFEVTCCPTLKPTTAPRQAAESDVPRVLHCESPSAKTGAKASHGTARFGWSFPLQRPAEHHRRRPAESPLHQPLRRLGIRAGRDQAKQGSALVHSNAVHFRRTARRGRVLVPCAIASIAPRVRSGLPTAAPAPRRADPRHPAHGGFFISFAGERVVGDDQPAGPSPRRRTVK